MRFKLQMWVADVETMRGLGADGRSAEAAPPAAASSTRSLALQACKMLLSATCQGVGATIVVVLFARLSLQL